MTTDNPIDRLKGETPIPEGVTVTPMPPEAVPNLEAQPPTPPTPPTDNSLLGGATVVDATDVPTTPVNAGGYTGQQLTDTLVVPNVLAELEAQRGVNRGADAAAANLTQQNFYPNLYRPPNFEQLTQDYRTSIQWQSQNLDRLTGTADGNAEFAQRMLQQLQRIEREGSTAKGFDWVYSLLGLQEQGNRKYMRWITNDPNDPRKLNTHAIGGLLFALGLAQNVAMGAAIDISNQTSRIYNALPPWAKGAADAIPRWLGEGQAVLASALTGKPYVAPTPRPQSPSFNRLNDGKSNILEALRGAQYSFSDKAGSGFGIDNDKGFRVGAAPGKGFGFDVNPMLLLGVGLDVAVGLKVDKLFKPRKLPPRVAKAPINYREALDRPLSTAAPTPTGFTPKQLEIPFVSTSVGVKPPAPAAAPKLSKKFEMANRAQADAIYKMRQAARKARRNTKQLSLQLDDLPEAVPVRAGTSDFIVKLGDVRAVRAPRAANDRLELVLSPTEELLSSKSYLSPTEELLSKQSLPSTVEELLSKQSLLTPVEKLQQLQRFIGESNHLEVGGVKVTTTTQKVAEELGQAAKAVPTTPDEIAAKLGLSSLSDESEVIGSLADAIRSGSSSFDTVEEIYEVLDSLPAVVADTPGAQAAANVINASIKGRALRQLIDAVGEADNIAQTALDVGEDLGRKFISEAAEPRLRAPITPPTESLPLGAPPKKTQELYHGSRVANHDLTKADPTLGGARNELGTAHYLSTTKKTANLAAKADSAVNLPTPEGVTREFGSPVRYSVTLDPTAKLIDATAKSPTLTQVARDVAKAFPELADDFPTGTPLNLVEVFDVAAKRLDDEATSLEFQRHMVGALRDMGYSGARAKTILAIYDPAVIRQGGTTQLKEIGVVGQAAARKTLEGVASTETASAFSKAAAEDAAAREMAQLSHELKPLVDSQAVRTAKAVDDADLWGDTAQLADEVDELDEAAAWQRILDYDAAREAAEKVEKVTPELGQLVDQSFDDLAKKLDELQSELDELKRKPPCEM